MTEHQSTLIKLTADIAAAYLTNNKVQFDQVPDLIRSVFGAMAGLGSAPEVANEPKKPAVSIKKSVTDDALTCLCCGKRFSMLKRHLRTDHDMTIDDYRSHWNLPHDYPMTAPIYAAQRSKLAKKIGLGRKPGQMTKK